MYHRIDRVAELISRGLALFGGFILLAVIALTCVSIIGRALVPLNIGASSVRGIYDMTEIGMAAAIFAFLPWCQYNQGHATVDLFQAAFPKSMNKSLDLIFNAAMFIVAAIGTWRLYLGMLDKHSYGETTLIAQIPVWLGYAVSLIGASGFVAVAAFCVLRALHAFGEKDNTHVKH